MFFVVFLKPLASNGWNSIKEQTFINNKNKKVK